MRIEFESAPPVDAPTLEDVDRSLRALTFPDNSFAILAAGPQVYIQAAMDDDGAFVVEYRDGSADGHYRTSAEVAIDDVVGAFQSYLRQDGVWRSRFEWQKFDVGAGTPPPPHRHRTTGRRPARVRSAPATDWRSAGCLVAFYAVLLPVAAALMVSLLRSGVEGFLGTTGLAGDPGHVVVTVCHPNRYSGGCSGTFTPTNRLFAIPSDVSVVGFYHAGDALDVHLLDGAAWPQGGSAAGFWIAPLLFGGFFAVGFVAGIVDVVRRTWKRLRAPQAVAGGTAARARRRRRRFTAPR
jgi:hypothetical protein